MTDNVAQFISITDTDTDVANHFLSAANNNLELALSLYMDNDQYKSHHRPENSKIEKQLEGPRSPILPSRTKLVNNDYSYTFTDNIKDSNSPFSGSGDASTNDEVTNRLANLYKSPSEIMFIGGFESAKKIAKEGKKLLLISFHDPQEFCCQILNRDVWNNKNIQEFIKESFIFLQVNTRDTDYDKLKHYYSFNSLPYTIIVDSRTGKLIKSWTAIKSIDEFLQDTIKIIEK